MKLITLCSGGPDSTVLLYSLLAEGHQVEALGFDYGQKSRKEIACARKITSDVGVEYNLVDLSPVNRLLRCALTSDDWEIPNGHYADEKMKQTVVPNRNMIMLAIAAGYCISKGFDGVSYAPHAGDYAIYPDCRPEFVEAVRKAVHLCDWAELIVYTPFLYMTKSQIIKRGAALGVPFGDTWSCYRDGESHCGKCGSCVQRREAFELAGVEDPTVYEE